jgi:aspartyl-tRNA(Asn)/glutamyl-tRNA(Gln) amidotransferase subunit C
MSIRREDVLHVARLAELDVAEADLPKLVDQMGGIVAFVEQLNEVPAGEQAPPFLAGPDRAPLREDKVDPIPLVRPPSAIAPDFTQGLFAVPRLGAMEGE